MRVTRIAGDFNDIGDKPCRVFLNEVEILDWTVADDFRRVVETDAGPRFGSVRIEWCKTVVQHEAQAERFGVMPTTVIAEQVEAPDAEVTKPNIHVPARKRKASR